MPITPTVSEGPAGTLTLAHIKAMHDLSLAANPDHQHPHCPLCDVDLKEITVGDQTYNQEQLDAAVATAVTIAVADAVTNATAPLQVELETLRAEHGQSEVEQAVAAATADHQTAVTALETQITELETERDTAVADATAAREELTAMTTERDEAVTAAAFDEVKAARVAAVTDLEFWPGTFIEDKADAWAELDEEAWAAKLTDLEEARDAAREASGPAGPPRTRSVVTATSDKGKQPPESAARRVIHATRDSIASPSRDSIAS